jgi:hypothetical protein
MSSFWAGAVFAFIVFFGVNHALTRVKAALGKWAKGGRD